MSPEQLTPGSFLWARVRDNANENRPWFHESGIHEHAVEQIHCDECGAHESALFWTQTRRSIRALHLECPYCGRGTARYLRRDRRVVPGPPFARAWIISGIAVVVVGLIASAVILQGDELMRFVDLSWPRLTGQSAEVLPWNRP